MYSDPSYEPAMVFQHYKILHLNNNWQWDGLHVLHLPVAFLMAHIIATTATLAEITKHIAEIETTLAEPYKCKDDDDDDVDFGSMIRELHALESRLITLRNRSVFERGLIKSVEHAWAQQRTPTYHSQVSSTLDLSKSRLDAREPQLAIVLKSIESQRAMVPDPLYCR